MTTETTTVEPNVAANNANKKDIIKWAVSFGLPLLFLLLPLNLDGKQKLFLALTLWAVVCWITEIFPNEAVGLMLPALYVVFQIAPAPVVFAPWANSMIWMTLGGLILGTVMIETGVTQRVAYWCILRVGGGLKGLLWGIGLAGVVLAIIVPSNIGRLSILIPLAVGICQALDIKALSKDASAVMLATFFAICCPGLGVLTGAGQNILANGVFAQAMGYQVTFVNWFIHMFFPSIVWTAFSIFCTIAVLKPGTHSAQKTQDEVRKKAAELGSMKRGEIQILVVVGIIIVAFLTQKIHGIDPNYLFPLFLPIYFMPGFKLISNAKFMKMNILIIFFIAGAMSIGAVCDAVGLSKVLAASFAPLFSGSAFKMVMGSWALGTALNFLLTPLAMVATFTGLLAQMAVAAGITPEAIMYGFLFGADTYIFPYEFAFLLFVMGFGYLSLKDLIRVMIPRSLGALVFVAVVCYPFWKLIGLL